jgi:lipooligosaccharide transport system permease protein
MALIFNALANGYDFFTYYFTLFLTPMTFLSGVFFPQEQLPSWLQKVAYFLPLSQSIALVRPLFFDQWPSDWAEHLALLLLYACCAYWIAWHLSERRFLRSH